MNPRLLECIIDGSIVITSLEVLSSWIAKFPNHPRLLRIYADLLAVNRRRQAAAVHYERAARIFLEQGDFLPGMAAKIRHWQTLKPKKEEIAAFQTDFRDKASHGNPAVDFWKNLTPDELLAIYPVVENASYPSGANLKQIGEEESALYFVVAGKLKESNYRMVEDQQTKFKKPINILKPNDIFGAVYPFSEPNRSTSHIVTLARTQLIRIDKQKLIRLCRMHPQLEPKIIDLIQIRHSKTRGKFPLLARKAMRYGVSAPAAIEIFPSAEDRFPIKIGGYSRDLSVSGLCFLISDNRISESQRTFLSSLFNGGQRPTVRVILSVEKMSLSISGKIVRLNKVLENGQIHLALGIKFAEMSPLLGGAFFAFAEIVGILNPDSKAMASSSEIR